MLLEPTSPRESSNSLVSVMVSNKRLDSESFQDSIRFDCTYTLARDAKPTRAVKGLLVFSDLFDEVKFKVQITLDQPLMPGKPTGQTHENA